MITFAGSPHDLGGGFTVQRILPNRQKRMVGPFVFLDHMGPVTAAPDQNTDVRPHPHIGLSTLTYLYQGHISHKDSLGSEQVIEPGEVNWMTAGEGIVHSERTPQNLKNQTRQVHGLQFWVALPDHLEECAPDFAHYEKKSIPFAENDDHRIEVVCGDAFGLRSPVKTTSPLLFASGEARKNHAVHFQSGNFEIGLYIVEGEAESNGHKLDKHQIMIFEPGQKVEAKIKEGSRFAILGGEPFKTPRFIWWNLVSSSKEKIEAAKRRWKEQAFPKIVGETEFIPLPEI